MPPLTPRIAITTAEFAQLRGAHTAIPVDDAVFRIEGSGAIDCLQGLLTNDVVRLASGEAAWGAFLTPKGMIITDAWVLRDGASAWVLVPAMAHQTAKDLFARTMPPRMARVTDLAGTTAVRWLLGGVPGPDIGAAVARPREAAPFTALALTDDGAALDAQLGREGWRVAPASHAAVVKVLAGWPTLGQEIDERTLPQEVRFDDLGGVRYDKGCYTGQETVARLHFRGHANRELRGIAWAPGEQPTDTSVTEGDKSVGTLRTLVWVGERTLALAILRHDVAVGATVRTGETDGAVIRPPFDLADAALA